MDTAEILSLTYKGDLLADSEQVFAELNRSADSVDDGEELTPEEIIAFCREHMAHFKAPRKVVLGELPKTATGKIRKNILRDSL